MLTDIVARPINVPTTGLTTVYFTSSGTWTCPDGVTNILVIAAGGGEAVQEAAVKVMERTRVAVEAPPYSKLVIY